MEFPTARDPGEGTCDNCGTSTPSDRYPRPVVMPDGRTEFRCLHCAAAVRAARERGAAR